MEHKENEAIKSFVEKICAISPPVKILFIGSNSRKREQDEECNFENDFDIIIIIQDAKDSYEYIKLITPILRTSIIESGIMITAYPIKQSVYENGSSEFLDNVRNKAKEIWKS
jgi:hypothetical protein